jgi:CubicO group peptidase (beta-lactamase class C family)
MKNQVVKILIMIAVLFSSIAYAVDVAKIVENTTAYLESLNTQNKFTGAVLIAKDGIPILTKAYGMANRSFNVPNQIDTKFNLASMNKMFTAVAILQLVEQGKLSLNDKIIKYIPEYANQKVANQVTIDQLLNHTSGLGHYWTEEYYKMAKDQLRTVTDYLKLSWNDSLAFPPGSKFSYSNAGFIVLGFIIEKITGQSYYDYVKEHIYKPAGMINTDAYENDYVVPNLAIGYTTNSARPGEIKNNLFMHGVKGGPAGGGYSTVEDLLRFGNALLSNKLLSPKYTKMAITGKVVEESNSIYGYGFRDRTENGYHIYGHTGGFPGVSGYLGMIPKLGYTIVVLSNFDNGSADVSLYIEEQLVGKTQRTRNRELTEMILNEAIANGYESAVKLYQQNKSKGQISEPVVNQRGYTLLAQKNTTAAIDVFRFNVYLYPKSANVYDSLGEAYMLAGNTELAIENYEKSLALNPNNRNAVENLKNLKEK